MQSKKSFDKPPIVFMGAVDTECRITAEKLDDSVTFIYGDCTFTEGYLDGYPVVVIKTLYGMVNAALATTLAVETYKPKCIVFNGTAGAHNPDLHQGDIIIGEKIGAYTGFYTPRRGKDEGLGALEDFEYYGKEIIVEEKAELVKTLNSDEELMKIAEKIPSDTGEIRRGTVLSGDFWNREIDRILFYRKTFGSDCEEMEGFSIAQVCAKFKTPFLLIRIISNSEFYPEELFDEIYGVKCQEYTRKVLKEIIKSTV